MYWYDRPGIEPFWAITRYEDVHRLGRDARRFINGGPRLRLASADHDERMWEVKAKRDQLYGWDPDEPIDMVFMDDPDHLAFRSIVNRAFTPVRCRKMADSLAGHAKRFVDEFEAALRDARAAASPGRPGRPPGRQAPAGHDLRDDGRARRRLHRHLALDRLEFDSDSMAWAQPGRVEAGHAPAPAHRVPRVHRRPHRPEAPGGRRRPGRRPGRGPVGRPARSPTSSCTAT